MGTQITGFWVEPHARASKTSSAFPQRIPVQMGLKPYDIEVERRGIEPSYLHLHYTDERFDGLSGPVDLVFSVGQNRQIYRNWVVVRIYRYDAQTKVLLLADVRHLLTYAEFTGGFNITVAGATNEDEYREGTLDNGQPYMAHRALQHAVQTMLTDVDTFGLSIPVTFSSNLKLEPLVPNLGNSPYGGFQGARYNTVASILCFAGDMDLVATPQGGIRIVDRYASLALGYGLNRYFPKWETAVEPSNLEPERPTSIVYTFGKRVEKRFEYRENVPKTAAVAELEIENVMPDFNGVHQELYAYIRSVSGYNNRDILERALIPGFFPWAYVPFHTILLRGGAEFFAEMQHIAAQMPSTFRARFRVRLDSRQGEVLRPYVDLQLGHLKADGTTAEAGSVYMDYISQMRFSYDYPYQAVEDDVLNQAFSENVPYNRNTPAPFIAAWLTGDSEELIFEVLPETNTRRYRNHLPGLLVRPMRYPDGADMERGVPWGIVEATMALRAVFSMDVMYNGYQVEDRPGDPVRYSIEREVGGKGPVLYWPIEELEAAINESGVVLNEDELAAAVDHYHEQLLRNYADNRHGTLAFANLLPHRVAVDGDLLAKNVRVGYSADHSIETLVQIGTGIQDFRPLRASLKGVPPRKIG